MTEQATVSLYRYAALDDYVLEEIRGRYVHGTRDDRIRVLVEVYEGKGLPYELAALVVDDPDPLLRRWMAKNARELDFRERIFETLPTTAENLRKPVEYKYSDRNLWDRLAQDADPFVRAALHENPHYPVYGLGLFFAERTFADLPHDHRLALMRNSGLASLGVNSTVLKVFDVSDETFGLAPKQREELALAYLSNTAAMEASRKQLTVLDVVDASDLYYHEKERQRLWELLVAFPSREVRWYGFAYLGGEDKWKAAAYSATDDPPLRMRILINAGAQDTQTLKLGTEDADEDCRNLAFDKRAEPDTPSALSRWARIAWGVLVNLVECAVIILVLNKGTQRADPVVVPVLAMIYLTASAGVAALGRALWALSTKADRQFVTLTKHLSDPEHASYLETLNEEREQLKSSGTRFWIDSGFRSVEWIAAAWYLITAL